MKFNLLILSFLVSATSFGADQVRNESRTRLVGESVTNVSACSEPQVSTSQYQAPIIKQDGSYSQDKNGQIRYHLVTRITATSSFNVTKCQTQEEYMAQVTGSFWNSSESEIQGSAKQFGNVKSETMDITKSQDFDFSKMNQAAQTGGFLYYGNNGIDMANTLAEGLKSQVKAECEANVAQLQPSVVARTATICK